MAGISESQPEHSFMASDIQVWGKTSLQSAKYVHEYLFKIVVHTHTCSYTHLFIPTLVHTHTCSYTHLFIHTQHDHSSTISSGATRAFPGLQSPFPLPTSKTTWQRESMKLLWVKFWGSIYSFSSSIPIPVPFLFQFHFHFNSIFVPISFLSQFHVAV